MFWNKKSTEASLPDLPQPEFPTIKSENSDSEKNNMDYMKENMPEKHNLPSFPDSPIKRGFSQTAIKNAIDNEEDTDNQYKEKDSEEIVGNAKKSRTFKTIEVDSMPDIPSKKLPLPPTKEEIRKPEINTNSFESKKKEVFVKIDKFQSARKALSSAQENVTEIENMLRKIRDVRMREDQELTAWERDIESVKVRIEEISKNIFEKV